MYKLIVSRDRYSEPRLWINFKENSEKQVCDYLKDILTEDFKPLAYLYAVQQVAIDQIEPFQNKEEIANEIRLAYEYYKNKEELTK